MTISITATEQTPTIMNNAFDTAGQQASSQTVVLDSSEKFRFNFFTCSSGCEVSNYQISGVDNDITSVSGLSSPQVSLDGMSMEVTVDTSVLQTIQFFLRAELTISSMVYGFSGQLQVEVICGSEEVSVTRDPLTILLTPESLTATTDLSTHFASSTVLCDIISYQAFSDSELTDPLASSSISLNPYTALLTIDQSVPQNTDVYVKALTQTTFGSQEVNVVICGEETITPTILNQYLYAVNPGQALSLQDIKSYFQTSFSLDSHQDCTQVSYTISSGSYCSENNPKFEIVTGDLTVDVTVDTDEPFQDTLCIQAETLGKKSAIQKIEFEICGNQDISLLKSGVPSSEVISSKHHKSQATTEVIEISSKGFSFETSSQNCAVESYALMKKDSLGQLVISEDPNVSLNSEASLSLSVDTSVTFENSYWIRAQSQSGFKKAYLQIDISVCGSENLTIVQEPAKIYKSKSEKIGAVLDFDEFFRNDNSNDCPIQSYKLKNQADLNDYEGVIVVLDTKKKELKYFPSLSEDKETDEALELFLEVESAGFVKGRWPFTLYLLAEKSNSEFIMQGPIFSSPPEPYYLIKFYSDNHYYFETIELPKISSPAGNQVELIQKQDIEIYRATSRTFETLEQVDYVHQWLGQPKSISGDNSKQIIKFEMLSSDRPTSQNSGYYLYAINLKDDQGLETLENIKVAIAVISYKDILSMNLEDIANLDIDITVEVANCKLREISKVELIFTGDDKNDEEIFESILKNVISFDLESQTVDFEESKFEGSEISILLGVFSGRQAYDIIVDNREKGLSTEGEVEALFKVVGQTNVYVEGINTEFYGGQPCGEEFNLQKEEFVESLKKAIEKSQNTKSMLNVGVKDEDIGKLILEKMQVVEEMELPEIKNLHVTQDEYEVFFIMEFSLDLNILQNLDQVYEFIKFKTFCSEDESEFEGSPKGRKLESSPQDKASQRLEFTYEVMDQDPDHLDRLRFQIFFKTPRRVSQSVFGRDRLQVMISKNEVLKFGNESLTLLEENFNQYYQTELRQIVVPDNNLLVEPKVMKTLKIAEISTSIITLILHVSMNKPLQDIFGMLNAQQILTHMMLLASSATAPSNIYYFNQKMSFIVQSDMFPMDYFYSEYFNFTESDSPVEQFEDLGYEGSNFMSLSGSLLINLILLVLYAIYQSVAQYCAKKFYRYEKMRLLGIKYQKAQNFETLLDIFMSGYLEIFICCLITFDQVRKQELYQNGSDYTAIGLAIFSILMVGSLPIMMGYQAMKKVKDPQEFNEKYQFLLAEVKTNKIGQAIASIIFILRRVIYVCLLYFMNDLAGFQLVLNILVSLVYVCYILHYEPYSSRSQNEMQVLVEVSVILCSIILIGIQTIQDLNLRYKFAFWYIIANSSLLIVNLYKLLITLVYVSIPQLYSKKKNYHKEKKYEDQILKWLEEKKAKSSRNAVSKEIYDHAKTIIEIRNLNLELIQLHQNYEDQYFWLKQNGLPVEAVKSLREKLLEKRKTLRRLKQQHNETNKQSGIRLGESFCGLRGLMFSLDMIRGRHFHHLGDEQVEGSWNNNLEHNGYYIHYLKYDGNMVAKQIALRVYEDHKKHRHVRREISQYLRCQPEVWGRMSRIPDYQKYLDETFSKPGKFFTEVELQAAAKLYNIPMILNGKKVFNAYTLEGNQQEALYFHKRGMLVHPKQKDLMVKFRDQLQLFKARNTRARQRKQRPNHTRRLSVIEEEPPSINQSVEINAEPEELKVQSQQELILLELDEVPQIEFEDVPESQVLEIPFKCKKQPPQYINLGKNRYVLFGRQEESKNFEGKTSKEQDKRLGIQQ